MASQSHWSRRWSPLVVASVDGSGCLAVAWLVASSVCVVARRGVRRRRVVSGCVVVAVA
ncbi:hypothetical protein ACXZ9C_11865 [Streptococcus agalactiae]